MGTNGIVPDSPAPKRLCGKRRLQKPSSRNRKKSIKGKVHLVAHVVQDKNGGEILYELGPTSGTLPQDSKYLQERLDEFQLRCTETKFTLKNDYQDIWDD